jgi:aryl-alcohol dehydrogenase (NADP+)
VAAFSRAARELGVPGPVTVQNTCSLVSRAVEGDLAESVFREGIAVLPYSPLAGGILTGKYRGGAKPERSRYTLFDTVGARYRKPLVFEACEAYLGVAERHGLTPVQLALGWLRTRWYVGAIILGATSVAQLDENLDAFAVELDAATLADVAAVQLRYPNPAGY